ncbi:Ankyrin repeat-containing domain protein, partial [Elaphomyces granulatus]
MELEPLWNQDMLINKEPQVDTLSTNSISHHHLATHNHVNIRCESCGRIFTRGKYSRHEKTHSRPNRCHCGQGFALKRDLERHKASVHKTTLTIYHCKVSGCRFKGSTRIDNLQRHMRAAHGMSSFKGNDTKQDIQSAYQDSLEEFKSYEGKKIQMITAFRGKIDIEQFLAESEDSIITNFGPGKTPLHVAALYGNVELVKALLSNNPGNNVSDGDGNLPLHYAAKNGHLAVVELLAAQDHDHINSLDSEARTPLSHAAEAGRESVVELFVARGLKGIDSVDRRGRTPIS